MKTSLRKIFLKGLVVGLTLGLAGQLWSAGNDYGPGSFFTYQGAGARANGMGGAFVAVADDAMAGFWNPAGLSQLDKQVFSAGMEYSFLSQDRTSSMLSGAFHIPSAGTVSLMWMNYTLSNIEGRDASGNELGSLTSSEDMLLLSYGQKLFGPESRISVGISAKMLRQSVDKYLGSGYGFDAGLLWQPWSEYGHTVGVNVQNLSQSMTWQDTNTTDVSSVNAKVGMALKFFPTEGEDSYNRLVQSTDVNISAKAGTAINIGAEYWYTKKLGVRGGYSDGKLTAGVSYRAEKFEMDYAYYYSNEALADQQHRISLQLCLGNAPTPGVKLAEVEQTYAPVPVVPQVSEAATRSYAHDAQPTKIKAVKIMFKANSAKLPKTGFSKLSKLADMISMYPENQVQIRVAGYANDKGTKMHNYKLSLKRAEAVKQYLIEQLGVPANSITVSGYGKTKLVAKGKSKKVKAKSRRVEVTLLAKR